MTAKIRSHSSAVTSRNGVGEVMPALLTTAPTGGTAAATVASALSTDAASVMSQPTPTACTPCCSAISLATSLAPASSRSRIAMFQPAAARAWAVARPIPRLEPAPVTTAVWSETDMGFSSEGVCQTVGGAASAGAACASSSALTRLTIESVDSP